MRTRSHRGFVGSVSVGLLLAAALTAPAAGQVTERVSISSLGAQGNGNSINPSISADGRYVVFTSDATNLVSGDTNAVKDDFVRDRCSPATSAMFSSDGINADTIAPVNAVLGSAWSAPLTLGHAHGTGGPVVLKLRSSTVNGPNFPRPPADG